MRGGKGKDGLGLMGGKNNSEELLLGENPKPGVQLQRKMQAVL